MKKNILRRLLLLILLSGAAAPAAATQYPLLSDYAAPPLFVSNPVTPNIMIMLDNSIGMREQAYASNYQPLQSSVSSLTVPISADIDSVMDLPDTWNNPPRFETATNYSWLSLGALDGERPTSVGLKFNGVDIPPRAIVTNAYIEFSVEMVSSTWGAAPIALDIFTEDNVNPAPYQAVWDQAVGNVANRAYQPTPVAWRTGGPSPPDPWSPSYTKKQTPELRDSLQQLVDKDGWASGNEMAFMVRYQEPFYSDILNDCVPNPLSPWTCDSHPVWSTYNNPARDAYSYWIGMWDTSLAPKLVIEYEHDTSKINKYYGYFNPLWFYRYGSNVFEPAYKKIRRDNVHSRWEVEDLSGVRSYLTDAVIASGSAATGFWDGNFMNWVSMRRIDVARKVLMGGLATSRNGGGNQTNIYETTDTVFYQSYDPGSFGAVVPWGGSRNYRLAAGNVVVDIDGDGTFSAAEGFTLKVQKLLSVDPDDYLNGDLSGVMQKVGDKAYWGNLWFNYGEGNNKEGGTIANPIGTNMTTLVTDLQNTSPTTQSPVAEAYYVAMQYFKQEKPPASLGYPQGAIGALTAESDPYYVQTNHEFVECAKSFVLLISDGVSSVDTKIPASYPDENGNPVDLRDYDGDSDRLDCTESDCTYPNGGSDYLDDIALFARANDLRADLPGEQNLILYAINALGNNSDGRALLKAAAKNGGFTDKDGDKRPNLTEEWDKNNDGDPDTYFEASDGYILERKLMQAINDILQRAASGTAVSVLATSAEGEGNLVQAYFNPAIITFDPITSEAQTSSWVGFLQSLWIDSLGNLRENTWDEDPDFPSLDLHMDKVIRYEIDAAGNTQVLKYPVSADNKYPDLDSDTPEHPVTMDQILPVWEAGSLLSDRNLQTSPRRLLTYLPGYPQSTPPYQGNDSWFRCPTCYTNPGAFELDAAEATSRWSTCLATPSLPNCQWLPYLGLDDDLAQGTWNYLGPTEETRAYNLFRFLLGYGPESIYIDQNNTNIRSRLLDGRTWRLGDIVHSTPVSVSLPPDRFDSIYSDLTYYDFYRFHKGRDDLETMVYVGANDGMLHAFTSWQYNSADRRYNKPVGAGTDEQIGDEIWTYIPNALLPHLKWLADPAFESNHVYYVDMKPKVVSARIFYKTLGDPSSGTVADDDYHKNGWGVVLLGGLNLGGKLIRADGDFDYNPATPDTTGSFVPSLFAIDISRPRHPRVLWERSYSDMGFTTNEPAVMKVGEKWYAVVGSGPDTYAGSSSRTGKVYVIDLATGEPYRNAGNNDWLFDTGIANGFMGEAASLDRGLNYNVDAVYLGETHYVNPASKWDGAMFKITIPWKCTVADCTGVTYGSLTGGAYITDPLDTANGGVDKWYLGKIFASPAPITAAPSLSTDSQKNAWVFFGTGRFFSQADKTDMEKQYLYGIKDAFFNLKHEKNPTNPYNYRTATVSDYYLNYRLDRIKTWQTTDLFPADNYEFTFPWGYIASPAGDCSAVPAGRVGDIYADGNYGTAYTPGSCRCEYDWPINACSEITPGHCAAVNPASELFSDGDCVCVPFNRPRWSCTATVAGACNDVGEGEVGDIFGDGSCVCEYWSADGQFFNSCLGVAFGAEVTAGGDGTCYARSLDLANLTKVDGTPLVNQTSLSHSCVSRVAGDCTGILVGFEGDFSGDGGSCFGSYWTCEEAVEGSNACATVDYTLNTNFMGPSYDGDYFGDGSCLCELVEEPVALVTDTLTNATLSYDELVTLARAKEGWSRSLIDPGERSLNKPGVLGGIALFSTYVPTEDICSFGGYSYLWALYYETGTAYRRSVIGVEEIDGQEKVLFRVKLGAGKSSGVSFHVGAQGGKKFSALVQSSTGAILIEEGESASNIRSGLISWRED